MHNVRKTTVAKISAVIACGALLVPTAAVQAAPANVSAPAATASATATGAAGGAGSAGAADGAGAPAAPGADERAEVTNTPLLPVESPWVQEDEQGQTTQLGSQTPAGEKSVVDASDAELGGNVTLTRVDSDESGEVYELKAELNVNNADAATDADAVTLGDISFARDQVDFPAQWVDDVKINGESVSNEKAEVFEYPEADTDLDMELPEDLDGDLLTIDTTDLELAQPLTVTARVHMPEDTPRDADLRWRVYNGDADAFDLNNGARMATMQSRQATNGSVPAGHSRVVVQVGGDRIVSAAQNNATRANKRMGSVYKFTPGAGAVLQLYAPQHGGRFGNTEANQQFKAHEPATPINQPWATCTADVNGECSFDIPTSGPGTSEYYWVGMTKASPGYTVQTEIRTGVSGSRTNTQETQLFRYAYATPKLESGQTYYSGVNYNRKDGNGSDWQATGRSGSFMYELPTPFDSIGTLQHRSSLGVFMQVRENPAMPNRCGLNAGMIIDTSGSMKAGADTVKGVVNTVIDGLSTTPTKMGFVSFDNRSPGFIGSNLDPVALNTPAGKAAAKQWANSIRPDNRLLDGATNWEDGLRKVVDYNDRNPNNPYDVVYMVTDGNPTVFNRDMRSGHERVQGTSGEFRHMEAAMGMANRLKAQGTRVVAVGIPSNWPGKRGAREAELEVSNANLQAISGPRGTDSDSLRARDFILYEESAVMQQALINALNTCAITVERRFYEGEDNNVTPTPQNTRGTIAESANWEFNAELTPSSGRMEKQSQVPEQPNPYGDNKMAEFGLNGHTDYTRVDVREPAGKIPAGWQRMDAGGGKHAQCFDGNGTPVEVTNLDAQSTNDFRLTNVPAIGGTHCIVYYSRPGTPPAPKKFGFELTKVDADNTQQQLTGAQFELRMLDDAASPKVIAPSKTEGAVFGWSDLDYGRYQLTETKAADDGYTLIPQPVYFRVAEEGIYLLSGPADTQGTLVQGEDTLTFPIVAFAKAEDMVTMRLANTKAGQLPKTGGAGAHLPALAGMVIVAAAFASRRRFGLAK